MTLLSWADGKKTYITVGLGIALGVAQGFGVPIPSWVDWILGFMGLGFHRSALTNAVAAQSLYATQAFETLFQTVVTQTSKPVEVITTGNVVPVLPATATSPAVTVTIGQPSPATATEEQVTDALNAAQLSAK